MKRMSEEDDIGTCFQCRGTIRYGEKHAHTRHPKHNYNEDVCCNCMYSFGGTPCENKKHGTLPYEEGVQALFDVIESYITYKVATLTNIRVSTYVSDSEPEDFKEELEKFLKRAQG